MSAPSSTVRFVIGLASVIASLGCCGQQEQKVADLETALAKMQEENTKLSTEIENAEKGLGELEAKLDTQASVILEMQKRELQAQERLSTLKGMLQRFRGMIETGRLLVKVLEGKMVLELPSEVLFDSGSAEISETGKATLAEVAEVLKTIKGREFQVAGHTDNKAISKDNQYATNWHLSAARAVAVVIFLKDAGVPPRQLSAAGYGPFRPVASNKNKKGQARNRRIEITLMPNLDELPDLSDLQGEIGSDTGHEDFEESLAQEEQEVP